MRSPGKPRAARGASCRSTGREPLPVRARSIRRCCSSARDRARRRTGPAGRRRGRGPVPWTSGSPLPAWDRRACFIANCVKCRPPQNREPHPDEIGACLPYLERQIAALAPRAIVCLGRIASQALLGTSTGVGALRGKMPRSAGIPSWLPITPARSSATRACAAGVGGPEAPEGPCSPMAERRARGRRAGAAGGAAGAAARTGGPPTPTAVFPRFVEVAFNLPVKREFTYRVPERHGAAVGCRISAPFGSRKLTGVVVGTADHAPEGVVASRISCAWSTSVPGHRPNPGAWHGGWRGCTCARSGRRSATVLPGRQAGREADELLLSEDARDYPLAEQQLAAVHAVTAASTGSFYLFGVTGSARPMSTSQRPAT